MSKEEVIKMTMANHETCLLSATMKDCKNCKFNPDNMKNNNTVSTQGKEETK